MLGMVDCLQEQTDSRSLCVRVLPVHTWWTRRSAATTSEAGVIRAATDHVFGAANRPIHALVEEVDERLAAAAAERLEHHLPGTEIGRVLHVSWDLATG